MSRYGYGYGYGSGGGAGQEWTPADLPSVIAWYDAKTASSVLREIVGKPTLVSGWNSIVGAAQPLAGTETYAPTYANSLISFNTNKVLGRANTILTGANPATVILIAKVTSGYMFTVEGNSLRFYASTATTILRSTATLAVTKVDAVMAASVRLLYFTHTPAGNSQIMLKKCAGTIGSPTDATVTGDSGTYNLGAGTMRVGASNDTGASGATMDLAAVILMPGALSNDDATKLYAFCQTYYGIE